MNRTIPHDKALLVVDFQYDFCSGGALPVPHADDRVAAVRDYVALFHAADLPVVASRDWHPPRSTHFTTNGGRWPPHCVRGTAGAGIHRELHLPVGAHIVSKGSRPDEDGYSAFEGADRTGRSLDEILDRHGVNELFVAGLATDHCVLQTVLDALERGLETWVLTDAVAGVDAQPGDIERAVRRMQEHGARFGSLLTVMETLHTPTARSARNGDRSTPAKTGSERGPAA